MKRYQGLLLFCGVFSLCFGSFRVLEVTFQGEGLVFQKAAGGVGGIGIQASFWEQNRWLSPLRLGLLLEGGWIAGEGSFVSLFSMGVPISYTFFTSSSVNLGVVFTPLMNWLWVSRYEIETGEMVLLGEVISSSITNIERTSFLSEGIKGGLMVEWKVNQAWALISTIGYHYRHSDLWGPFLSMGIVRKFNFSQMIAQEGIKNEENVLEDQQLEEKFTNFAQTVFDKEKNTLILTNIGYAVNQYTIPEECFPILEEIYAFLVQNTNYSLVVSGHTDDVGNERYNFELSEKRAKAIAEFFIEKGIDPRRIKWKGYGKSRPRVEGKDEISRAQNRRVEIEFVKENIYE
jgi:outer membrane protein OmpA-like peptidoglycan-associated protein